MKNAETSFDETTNPPMREGCNDGMRHLVHPCRSNSRHGYPCRLMNGHTEAHEDWDGRKWLR